MRQRLTVLAAATCALIALNGCGNQMYRQPSYTPLDTPRAAPPENSVPVSLARTPMDGRPAASPAYGDKDAAQAFPKHSPFSSREPDLPPPNLSDAARYQAAPAAVNVIKNPLPEDPRIVKAGHILFLNRCVQCHNAGGYGYGTVGQYLVPHPPDLAAPLVQHISNGALFWHITMGQGKMPGFRHWTTPTERWSLVEYVRSLRGLPKDPNVAQTSTALSETPQAPYPVYGIVGYEHGKGAYPFKSLNPATTDSDSRRNVINQGFGQRPSGSR